MAFNPRLVAVSLGGIAAAITLITPTIQRWEGNAPIPYKDLGGVLSVCHGHTGADIVIKKYEPSECTDLLKKDMDKAAQGVLKVTPNLAERPYQLGAAISFTYNLGSGVYAKSSVARDFKSDNYLKGCQDMLKYVYVNKTYSRGLDNRRHDECRICVKGLENVGSSPCDVK